MCVFCMLGFMQCSEAHSNTSKSTTWDHQIKKIYSVVLAYAVNSGDWSLNNKPRGLIVGSGFCVRGFTLLPHTRFKKSVK